ncbi:aspartate/glutamate racemase family protein [Nocardioides sp. zg-1228]|nr:aspartate/glutamate racemase family protein [Nocardioides sp. zg-1228]
MLRRIDEVSASHPDGHQQPELSLVWQPLAGGADAWQRNDPDTVRTQLALGATRLREAGAHFFVCPDDTAYAPLDEPGADLALPGLHAASVVAAEAQRHGYARVGVLGTRWTLEWRRYADELEPMGIAAVPLALTDQTTLHSIVFDELVHGRTSLRSRDVVLELIDGLRLHRCQAVVLGCSELGALVTPAVSPLPLLDTTRLLADAATAVAVGDAPLPHWRGGPGEPAPGTTSPDVRTATR